MRWHAAGVTVEAARLGRHAGPHAKRSWTRPERVRATNDATRGWKYFNLVLTHAGIPLSSATDDALAELHEYHARHNLWESVPTRCRPRWRRSRASVCRWPWPPTPNAPCARSWSGWASPGGSTW